MAPVALTPSTSGTTTPTTTTLTTAGIQHALTPTPPPRPVPHPTSPETHSQKTCTDHMITATWTSHTGWSTPHLHATAPLALAPTASVLHYATTCFEGLKLYRGHDGRLRLFRPARNCARLQTSARRVALPDVDPAELQRLIVALARVDGPKWLARETRRGGFLYVRPAVVGTDAALGVQRPREALLMVVMVCFPDMSGGGQGAGGLRLLASREDAVRAWPGGFGNAKLGANYGPSLVAQGEARERGFDQVLWLFGSEGFVTEAGASNFFVVWRTRVGGLELVTAPLEGGVILEGVTRASILELVGERLREDLHEVEAVVVVERRFTMLEIVEALEEGRLVEAFAAGTAFFVAPVGMIHFRGRDLEVPMVEGDTGTYAKLIKSWLVNIMYGKEEHEWGVIVEEDE